MKNKILILAVYSVLLHHGYANARDKPITSEILQTSDVIGKENHEVEKHGNENYGKENHQTKCSLPGIIVGEGDVVEYRVHSSHGTKSFAYRECHHGKMEDPSLDLNHRKKPVPGDSLHHHHSGSDMNG